MQGRRDGGEPVIFIGFLDWMGVQKSEIDNILGHFWTRGSNSMGYPSVVQIFGAATH